MGARFDRRFHVIMTIFRLRRVVEIRLYDLIPSDFFARVTGKLSHDSYHRATGHIVAVIDRLV